MDDDEDNDLPLNERVDLINRNDPSVTKFELKNSERRTVTEDQFRALFRALQHNTHVRKLDLFGIPQDLRGTVCQQLLPPLLQENSLIEDLRFPYQMSNVEFLPSVDALCNNNNNTIVKTLGMNSLGPAGASQIAAPLGDNDCALEILDLGWCGIGDEGIDALCTALHVNNSLEAFLFYGNEITDDGYRILAGSLPHMSGLRKILFGWEQRQVSAAVLQQMIDGLQKNQSLQCIVVWRQQQLSEEQRREWETCCAFVGARNKMKSHLDELHDAARDGRVVPVPIPICSLLSWCCRQGNSEVQDSLVYYLLRLRVNEIAGLLADAQRAGKRPANRTDTR